MPDDIRTNHIAFETDKRQIFLNEHSEVFSPTGFAQAFARVLEAKLPAKGTVCELGLGSGVLAILAGLKGAKVVGLDRNQSAVELAQENWFLNDLPATRMDFRESDLFSGLRAGDENTFDVMWSNPPLLPDVPGINVPDVPKYRNEVSGPLGRNVLDAMILQAGQFLKPGGSMLTIATSLQGWQQTKALLDQNWINWRVIDEVKLPLTDECGPEYVAWWKAQQDRSGETYLEERGSEMFHTLWFIEAENP